ncbi:MAG: glycogen/starch/alpha-glucan phosphorylase [Pseudomonadota bacterium]
MAKKTAKKTPGRIDTPEPAFLENTPEALAASMRGHLRYTLGKSPDQVVTRDLYMALAFSVRDRLLDRQLETMERYRKAGAKRLYYLSMEFLMGRLLGNNLHGLRIWDQAREAVESLGGGLEETLEYERDAGLGNGGLGRLAACFLDSMAALDLPGFGYGIHYDYGLFKQEINNGFQREKPDTWVEEAAPLQMERMDLAHIVPLYGRIEHAQDFWGQYNPMWMDWQVVIGVPYDIPVPGYGGNTVNYLRLYKARPSQDFDIRIFNQGDYFAAVEGKIESEKISKILYPSDTFQSGRELRLIQEYFLVSCALKDIIRQFSAAHENFTLLPDKAAIQLNDTHPSLSVAELMRILVDEQWLTWETAWDITTRTIAYTNHTLLPEALEKWSVSLLEKVLPRHLQIIHEINQRFLNHLGELWPGDEDRARRMSLIEEGEDKKVRMAHLAMVGSHSVNGVSALHTELVKHTLVPDFYELSPGKFNNKTNGITPRRWLLAANPDLNDLLEEAIGPGFITDLNLLRKIEPLADDPAFCEKFLAVKKKNKEGLARVLFDSALVRVDPDSLFDIQAKRIHEYKRQLLNVLAIVDEYLALVDEGMEPPVSKTYVFAGKAAPGYRTAKNIIKLIHCVADVVNRDRKARDLIRVCFAPDYRVTLAEAMIPAADLSEQISTAGFEASGTGNMKFALNGAVTIGTLDGANIEIKDEVGEENIYIFGLLEKDIARITAEGTYRPFEIYRGHAGVRRVLNAIRDNRFCPDDPGLFAWVDRYLLSPQDRYMHLADFPDYTETRARAGQDYENRTGWAKKAILNTARMGYFSSDRTVREYSEEIWGLKPVPKP